MGYIVLNDYLHKCNVKETANCDCGEKASVSHYLLDCPNYEKDREKMRKRLFDYCGHTYFDLNMLFDAKQEDNFKE